MSDLLKFFQDTSALYGSNAPYIENLYEKFLEDPDSIEHTWREKFFQLPQTHDRRDIAHSPVVERFALLATSTPSRIAELQGFTEESVKKQSAVARLINHYRSHGHEMATNNPLGKIHRNVPDLDPNYYGLSEPNMDTLFDTGTLYGVDRLPLKDIISTLKEIYCGNVGTEYMHIFDADIKRWIKNRLEGTKPGENIDDKKRLWLLEQLIAAEGIEKYLHRNFVGQKRFSLEGGESLIPILDEIIQRSGRHNTKELVIGMAHRGRLNVLINILGKSPAQLFSEFKGTATTDRGVITGDVKYHMGFSSNMQTEGGEAHVTMAFNPSHLEIINPVVEGTVKARQDRYGKNSTNTVIPILIHGDAAFAGQGIVMETLNMAQTRAFATGGTIHIVINNQIGFTTSNPFDARSTLYCTDVANMIQAPVFHVNGDDPEAVLFVTQMAIDYRATFNKDVVIDLICYRRRGHNEADEPSTTQPMMYKQINALPTTCTLYATKLIEQVVLTEQQVRAIEQSYQDLLNAGKTVSRPINDSNYSYSKLWDKYVGQQWDSACDTRVALERIRFCNNQSHRLPPGFELHPRVVKIMDNRRKMAAGAMPLDWGFAENMAYATLLMDQFNVRLVGQDVGRGTFFHRHVILHNQLNGESYIPIKHLDVQQGRAQVFDSILSEAGVLGFEYGYSSTVPETLTIWEAQFGDFANGAQVVIDQFISSGESKWGRLSGLVMLLPHGLEGQGPEHSSARLERYLQLCADQNMQVCVPSTPAQIFHLLRRQVIRTYRKPLIIMSPKSLLRHKAAVSTLEDLVDGHFHTIIPETDVTIDAQKVTRLILCSGKVYYDLLDARTQNNPENVAIVRIEQLYPFPIRDYSLIFTRYPNIETVVWCQEEPQNQGAWYQSRHNFSIFKPDHLELIYCGRPASASPAVGSLAKHLEQQKEVVESALYGQTTATRKTS
ncbi:2-oxoglutarate dehydrogenase E1 component [Bathymodiolus japonicus methanotrophic gill symbiont]|uniref:2-oxoglutarate dehydrogenase E1 component n=1 Tax=Bathymodiolus japonicus methanotrophic gill symbiont TaxID=113269 RepID=UPI001B3EB6CD|nr:2-oxoglutarate dehydrogenase E1 component [Bathymodiolus japonicus methanotrophic gill symbiont]GFO72334.1 2-oxoglutarate dehydrogenase E1 component [Bathymodiolus japonicus methanotrophic gill symbiont]